MSINKKIYDVTEIKTKRNKTQWLDFHLLARTCEEGMLPMGDDI